MENKDLLSYLMLVIGLVLIFGGGWSEANVPSNIEFCNQRYYVDSSGWTEEQYIECMEDTQTKLADAKRMYSLGLVITLLTIYIRIPVED
jgi:hypothetical protein